MRLNSRPPYLSRSTTSRRALLVTGLGAVAVAIAGCTKAVQARMTSESSPPEPRPTTADRGSANGPTATPGPATPGGGGSAASPGPSAASSAQPTHRPTAAAHSASTSTRPSVTERTATEPRRSLASAAPPARPPASRARTGPAQQVAHGPTDRPQVALTFHGAGDLTYARQILAIARTKRARLTVLAVGTWLNDNSRIGREILAGGHDIGNHTLSHLDINSLPVVQMRDEVQGCRDILRRTTGTDGSYFRQSQSQTANTQLLRVAGEAGYRICLSYNVDSMDYTDPGAKAVRENVAAAGAGSIVSMHLGHAGTVEALPGILDDLESRGLAAVTVSALLAG